MHLSHNRHGLRYTKFDDESVLFDRTFVHYLLVNAKQLEALVYVARCGTFRQAAESLYFDSAGDEFITPESVQYRVRQLEKELGVSLYRKRQGSPRVTLTREGQLFLPEAQELLHRISACKARFAADAAEPGAQVGGWVTVASTQALLLHRLIGPAQAFRAAHPAARLRLLSSHAAHIEELVEQGQVDFGISTRPPERPELEYVPWRRGELVLITPENHLLAKLASVTLADIAPHPLVVLEPELRGDRESMDDAFRRAGIKRLDIAVETANSELIKAYVEAGLGVAVIAETSVRPNPGRRLAVVPISDKIARSEAGLLVREGQFLGAAAVAMLRMIDPLFEKWVADRTPATPDGGKR